MNDETLEAVRRDYQVFTAIEQQLRDAVEHENNIDFPDDSILKDNVQGILKVIQQHKADLFQKYPL